MRIAPLGGDSEIGEIGGGCTAEFGWQPRRGGIPWTQKERHATASDVESKRAVLARTAAGGGNLRGAEIHLLHVGALASQGRASRVVGCVDRVALEHTSTGHAGALTNRSHCART